jgi:hypothetical protein
MPGHGEPIPAVGGPCLIYAQRCGGRRRVQSRYERDPLDEVPRDVSDAAHDAARGRVVYLTEHGARLAAIVPAELAAELEHLTPEAFRELVEEFADIQAAREALAEVEAGAKPVPAAQVWAELGIEAEPEIESAEIEGPEIEA